MKLVQVAIERLKPFKQGNKICWSFRTSDCSGLRDLLLIEQRLEAKCELGCKVNNLKEREYGQPQEFSNKHTSASFCK